ncbi:MAG: IS1595 family transposase [Actinobacteria bacterium]|nr:IS1595 family transposase [Actinomycetota bacterium]
MADRNNPTRGRASESTYSLMEFMAEYPDDAACLDFLWRERFAPDGHTAHCKKCDQPRRFYRVKDRPSYDCGHCGHHLNPLAGTIFHKSSTSLHLWFFAMYLMTSTRCGISAKQLERELGVTYKTAWRMVNLIRNQLMSDDVEGPLSGSVEVDETWHGGKMRHSDRRKAAERGMKHGPHVKPRATVMGFVERGGRVVAMQVPSRYGYTLRSNVAKTVAKGSTIYTDDYSGYSGVEQAYTHHRINHSLRVYVDGHVHTQTIEGFFSLFKNGVRGVYHSVSVKWLQGYLNEYTWRYNRRDSGRAMFIDLIETAASRAR